MPSHPDRVRRNYPEGFDAFKAGWNADREAEAANQRADSIWSLMYEADKHATAALGAGFVTRERADAVLLRAIFLGLDRKPRQQRTGDETV